jgi:hemophore-related protein
MKMSRTAVRRGLFGAFATCALGGVAAATISLPTASAVSAPCTASGLATTASGVLNAAGAYLHAHPGANHVLTAAGTQSPAAAEQSVRAYFTANPNEFIDLQNIVQPLTDMRNRCGMGVSPAQLVMLFDALAR